ncbi:MAG: glycoside hydrolase family 28 protein [Phycisphaerae bacterium]
MTQYNVREYGAVGDGETIDTQAIQAAIDAAAEAGGIVLVPPGVYLAGTVRLRSRVTLHLGQGARLLGSPDLSHYTAHSWGHHDDRTPYHLLFAEDAHHVAITGEGEINGNGRHFQEPDREHEWAFYREIPMRPSPMVEISRCSDVRVQNVRLKDPGGWTLHLHDCDRAFIHGVTIDNSRFWPNSDGIDLTGCHDTIISDCFIRTGDDAIALKTTIDSRSCEHITVTNCVLESSCAAIRLGFESDQDFRNCSFSNITIKNCSRAIDLLTFSGGSVENCSFTNIVGRCMSGWPLDRPIEISASFTTSPYKCRIPQHPNCGTVYPQRPPGSIRGITITNFDVETCGRIMMGAARGAAIEDISLNHIRLRYPMIDDPQPLAGRANGHAFFGDLPELRSARAAVVAQNVSDLRLRDWRIDWPTYPIDPSVVELLQSPDRHANPEYYGDMEAVLNGDAAPPYAALWARNLHGRVETRGLTPSCEEAALVDAEDCRLELRE